MLLPIRVALCQYKSRVVLLGWSVSLRGLLTNTRIRRRIVAHEHRIRCRTTEGVVLWQPAIVAGRRLVCRWRCFVPSSRRLVGWRIIASNATAMVVVHRGLGGAQQRLAVSKMHNLV